MNDLLNVAMKAHGGLERWKQVRNMQAKVTLNGTLWRIKGRPDGLSGVVMRLNTKQPDLTITPFPKPETAGHFTPSRVWIEDANGTVVSELKNPRDSFAGAVLTTKWNELQELYFASYAFWNYFTAPFLLAPPGVELGEPDGGLGTQDQVDPSNECQFVFPGPKALAAQVSRDQRGGACRVDGKA